MRGVAGWYGLGMLEGVVEELFGWAVIALFARPPLLGSVRGS